MLNFNALEMTFPNGFHALGPIDYALENHQVLGLVGPSGCGKSTLLRLVAGLEQATNGNIMLNGKIVRGVRADIGVVFQEPRLLPWKSVYDNVAVGVWDMPSEARQQAVSNVLNKVGLAKFANALPRQLSGGMAQRTGIARALVKNPKLLLLDEPFSALDPISKIAMQDHLLSLLDRDVPSALLVTHDMDEALVLCDCILVLEGPPAKIRDVVVVDLPKPRIRTSAVFQHYKERLIQGVMPKGEANE